MSDANDLDVPAGGAGERFQVVRVRRGDEVAVGGQQDERCVDDVTPFRRAQERAGRAPQLVVRACTSTPASTRASRAWRAPSRHAWPMAPPCETGTSPAWSAALSRRHMARSLRSIAISAAGIQNERHARRRAVLRPGLEPRTTRAEDRSRRCWVRSSSAVITPNSAS